MPMKKLILSVLSAVILSGFTIAQDTWVQKANIVEYPNDASFSIGNKGYTVTGFAKLWEYDQETNKWTNKAFFPGNTRANFIGFSIGNKGYIVSGTDQNSDITREFWEYNPANNTWTRKQDYPGQYMAEAAFGIGNYGYVGLGNAEFYKYDPQNNIWDLSTEFPGAPRFNPVSFSIGTKGYIGTGYSNGQYLKDFWQFDSQTNSWTRKTDLPGEGRNFASGFVIGSKGYIGTGSNGINQSIKLNDLWEYDPASNNWTRKTDFKGAARDKAFSFSLIGSGYIGNGNDYQNVGLHDVWKFTANPEIIINSNASWKYLDNGTNQGTSWRSLSFSDGAWKTGNAELGYGDGGETTVVSYGPSSTNKYITTYFRKVINITNVSQYTSFNLGLLRDDGAVVYVNGVEVARSNMPTGTISYTTLASNAIDGTGETTFHNFQIPASRFVSGNNIIAVEIHQSSGSSSDISFSLTLKGNIPLPTMACSSTGSILLERWYNVSGEHVNQFSYNTQPNDNHSPNIFEGPVNIADNYASRFRGYICPPVSGSYVFWIASDDDSELWLSTNHEPANKVKIVYVSGWTNSREWTKYSSQKSVSIKLVANTKYYIEALHKEALGGDNIAVGWQLPNGTLERPIPGNRLSPFEVSPNTCPTPTGIYASNVTSNSATIRWDAMPGAETYNIQYRKSGISTWTMINSTSNTVTISGLSSSTDYEVQVQTGCISGVSYFSPVLTFTTLGSSSDLILAGSVWKYLDDGSNQGTAWRTGEFLGDAFWKQGGAELGYGDGDEVTKVNYGPSATNKYITTYFRKSFNVADANAFTGLELSLIRDDGAVVYLNGVEVYRNNMPTGTIFYNTLAPTYIDGTNESTYVVANISKSALVTGNNVIAVEIHQNSPSSSDISFNLKLKGLTSGARIADTEVDSTSLKLASTEIDPTKSDFILYPNPTSGKFSFEFCLDDVKEENLSVEIVNAVGQVVYKKEPQKINGCIREIIELEKTLPSGIYMMNVITEKETKTQKVLLTN